LQMEMNTRQSNFPKTALCITDGNNFANF
jgi:hypothetical protein